MKVGLVHVTCPACGEPQEIRVNVASVELRSGYMSVTFYNQQNVEHKCEGSMS